MPPKKKKREPVAEQENAEIRNVIADLDLTKFCPEKIFEIIFITETDEYTKEVLNEILKTSRQYEDISCVTFITYDEVIDFMENFSKSVFPLVLQLWLGDIIQEIKTEFDNTQNLSSGRLATLMKLKLIDIMYQHYQKEISKMDRRISLEKELHTLSIDAKKGSKPTGHKDENKKALSSSINMDSKSKPKVVEKSFFESSLLENIDLTKLETENDIVFDDDISNRVWYYIFLGFRDSILLKELISVYKVPVRAVMRIEPCSSISNNEGETGNIYENFWEVISEYFDGPQRLTEFENTIFMKFAVSGDQYKELFEELLYVIKNISDIKFKHLNYIRHLKMHKFYNIPEILPLHCLKTYNEILRQIPMELVDEYIILSSLLEEIDYRNENNHVSEIFNLYKKISRQSLESDCNNPFDLTESVKINIPTKHTNTFLVQESDINSIISKSYKHCGALIGTLLLNIWKKVIPFNLLEKIEASFNDISHHHDINPSMRKKREVEDTAIYFMYLFLFNSLRNEDSTDTPRYSDSMDNLQTHDHMECEKLLKPVLVFDGSREDISKNLYDPSPMKYIWKEELSLESLIREVLKAQQEYMNTNINYSPETDDLLVEFSDNLQEFGIGTKIYEETVVTPVCLRDFCKYVSVEKANWLDENRPPKYVKRKNDTDEPCEGARKIRNKDLFKDYRYLLESKIILDENTEISSTNGEGEGNASFENILEQLLNYPKNEKLEEECRGSDLDNHFLAYDLGTKYVCVRGATTTFSSHDNVKIKIDNSSFIDEEPTCSVNLSCMNNTLTLHSKSFNEYNFHCTLENGTTISFIIRDPLKKTKSPSPVQIEDGMGYHKDSDKNDENEDEITSIDNINRVKVIAINADDFEKDLTDETQRGSMKTFDPDIYTNLKQAIVEECSVYKVDNRLNYIKKLEKGSEIPLTDLLRRIMYEPILKMSSDDFAKRYASPNYKKSDLAMEKIVDFRICLPNGLYISCYPSQINDSLAEIKQEYLGRPVNDEEFRIFTKEGTILIKKTDGTINLLKSNGDFISLEKPDSKNEYIRQSNLKTCHCKNINDYKNKVNNIMKRENHENNRYISRRAHFQSKKGYIISKEVSNVLENLEMPYLRRVLIGFDGNKTSLEKNKVTRKKVFHTICEHDFFADEIYFEREDGMQSILNKFGCQVVKFSDGTKITSTVHESNELMDGYVYVSLSFSFEHTNYATVSYGVDDDLKVCLNNNVCLDRYASGKLEMKIGSDVTTVITENTVEFEKRCNGCKSSYICTFDIGSLQGKKLNPSSQFLHAQDSYNKHFYVDYMGNCRHNTNFLNGPHNAFGCNHYKNNIYKKLFIIKRTSGAQLWSDIMIDLKKLSELNFQTEISENIDVLQFKRNHSESYVNRYLNMKVIRDELCLTKYKQIPKMTTLYTTVRVIRRVMDLKTVNDFLSTLLSYLSTSGRTDDIMKNLLKYYKGKLGVQSIDDTTEAASSEGEKRKKCKCRKMRTSFSEKISRWQRECDHFRKLIRDPELPLYFQSQFCQIVE